MIPDEVIALNRRVKKNKKGMFFNFGGELTYFEASNIKPEDEIIVIPLCWYTDDHKEYMISKDMRTWYHCKWNRHPQLT